jgi:molybdopterin molybdotransferase
LVFGLPGNPVSAMVCFVLLVRPALAVMAGRRLTERLSAVLAEDVRPEHAKTKAVPCRLTVDQADRLAHPVASAGSHVLTSMLGADGLAVVPPGADVLRAGSSVEVEPL